MTRVEYDKVVARWSHEAHRIYIVYSVRWGNYRVELWLDGKHDASEDSISQSRKAAFAQAELLCERITK